MDALGVPSSAEQRPDYEQLKERCKEFLKDHKVDVGLQAEYGTGDSPDVFETDALLRDQDSGLAGFKYLTQLLAIKKRMSRVLTVELDDVIAHGEVDVSNTAGIHLAEEIMTNTKRYVDLFARAADELLETEEELVTAQVSQATAEPLDVLMESRRRHQAEHAAERQRQAQNEGLRIIMGDPSDGHGLYDNGAEDVIPAPLTRRFQVLFIPPTAQGKPLSLRQIRADDIGKLVTFTGVVTRVSEVKPKVVVAGFSCDTCGSEVYQEVKNRQFLPISECPHPDHKLNKTISRLSLNTRTTKFSKFQELKIQENADQVPVGAIPRTMTVHLNGEVTRSATAGDVVKVSGVFLPVPYSGLAALKAGLLSDTYVEAFHVEQLRKSYEKEAFSPEIHAAVEEIMQGGNIFDRLSQSIAPEIYGHEDVKKALLLLMVGAPEQNLMDGMRLRGDLHIMLMGDPGVAKSQLLKYLARATPRGVYTTGKGSSGVGLTAAVVRDSVTNELMLEGGALILADRGICCIDEFDKMNEIDRTAIHEVMEQQTVSIAKAGITTTLNARAAVLAAANPAYGRYNRRKPPAQNINLPAALLSRFDLLFLLLDEADPGKDLRLAQHVTHVHRTGKNPPLTFSPVSLDVLRAYVAKARAMPSPVIPSDGLLSEYVVNHYISMREEEKEAGTKASGYTTARSLLSILRLAQALTRLRLSDEVTQDDVDEAVRLIKASKESISEEPVLGAGGGSQDPISAIYMLIRALARESELQDGDAMDDDEDDDDDEARVAGGNASSRARSTPARAGHASSGAGARALAIPIPRIENRVLAAGFSRQQLEDCLQEYDAINVWIYDVFAQKLRFLA
ncbi:DNA replication licensing factor MCM7 [Porphyridium purpureum]|uniref:DNA replication licensing factor MCM7 n=1 Tax=Porphyridium purpureum TaxID=35688 RepID=A0A5J4YS46_PORPP|nr:DNA replication licensing factor MCM7 [Porphyridium purpureum]|eukprot:POR4345..scf236_6